METIKCKNCEAEIEQLSTGSWIRVSDGTVFCGRQYIDQRVLHEPIVTPEWRNEIKKLIGSSPRLWTAKEVGKLMGISESTMNEILNS